MTLNHSIMSCRDLGPLGFPGYGVDTNGNIWSRWTPGRGHGMRIGSRTKRLAPQSSLGYQRVNLYVAGVMKHVFVHRLVLLAFVGPCPDGLQCRHLDGDRTNNALSNLCWGTISENMSDRRKHKTTAKGSRNGNAKLTENIVVDIRREYHSGCLTQRQLAQKHGVCKNLIGLIVRREIWEHVD